MSALMVAATSSSWSTSSTSAASAGSTDVAGTVLTLVFVAAGILVIALMYRQLRRVPRRFDPTLQDRPRGRRRRPGADADRTDPPAR